jgi:hypothetical protein
MSATLFPLLPAHAGNLLLDNPDRNFWIVIDDSLARDGSTSILYRTYPDITQAHAREACTTNLHVLEVTPGLSKPNNVAVVENFCGSSDVKGTLLINGDVCRRSHRRPGQARVLGDAPSDARVRPARRRLAACRPAAAADEGD